jgi:predicted TIM-barrel fold metal-dependent hydrolase
MEPGTEADFEQVDQSQGGIMTYQLVDMDQHFFEPDDCFSRHIEAKYRDLAIRPVPGGTDRYSKARREDIGCWALGDRRMSFADWNIADVALKPGTLLGVLEGTKSMSSVDNTAIISPKRDLPESMDRSLRLKVLDAQNVQATIMLPTSAVIMGHEFRDRPDVVAANLRSFNRWLEEDWGYGDDGRIFGVPAIHLVDITTAIEELERVVALGARFIYTKMGPVSGRSPAHPDFDPFWARVQEMAIRPVLHLDNHGYIATSGPAWGEDPDTPPLSATAFARYIGDTWRAVQDTIAAFVLQDLFGRFPGIEMCIIECGSEWVPSMLKFMDKAAQSASNPWKEGRRISDGKRPSEIMREHFYVAPFPEDDIPELISKIGIERVLFGSDWPHSEGVAEPADFFERLHGLSDDQVRQIMRTTGAELLGLDPAVV